MGIEFNDLTIEELCELICGNVEEEDGDEVDEDRHYW